MGKFAWQLFVFIASWFLLGFGGMIFFHWHPLWTFGVGFIVALWCGTKA